jgi:hypothetical protein
MMRNNFYNKIYKHYCYCKTKGPNDVPCAVPKIKTQMQSYV